MSGASRKARPPARPLWQEAAAFAARAHLHQVRKDGATPYVSHVFRVAMTVRDVFACDDPVALAAALLHDTIEDTTADYDEIAERFGAPVADVVAALTKNMALPEDEREREYDARLARADWQARLVKLADTFDNFHDAVAEARSIVRNLERCRRALALVEGEIKSNEHIGRAARAVRDLIAPYERPRRRRQG